MITLLPEEINFKISTTDVSVTYTERNGAVVSLEALSFENFLEAKTFTVLQIHFEKVAEVKCVSLNFEEFNYENFEIIKKSSGTLDYEFWRTSGYHPNSGLYEIYNSEYLLQSLSMYDPKNRFKLKHFLINGNDSYIEVIASKYEILKAE